MSVSIDNDSTLERGSAVVETSAGVKYAVLLRDTYDYIDVWKNIDGTPSREDWDAPVTIFGSSSDRVGCLYAAIDSNDDIHIIAAGNQESTRDVAYCIYDTGTDSLGSWEEAADYTEAVPVSPGAFISIDSSDKPHVLFVDRTKMTGATQDNVYYTDKTGASWASPTQVGARTTKTDKYDHPVCEIYNSSDYLVFLYYFSDPDLDIAWRYMQSSLGGENIYTETGATVAFPGATSSASGLSVYRYHFAGGTTQEIEQNNIAIGTGIDTRTGYERFGASRDADDNLYVFYIDVQSDVALMKYISSWQGETLQTGTYEYVIPQYSWLNNNQSGEINYIFQAGTVVSYDSYSLAAGDSIPYITSKNKQAHQLVR